MRAVLLLLVFAATAAGATPAEALAAALADAEARGPDLACRTRYLWLPATVGRDEAVLQYQVNALSREPELVRPRRVAADVWAVVLDDYGWSAATWERQAEHHPYTHYSCRKWWPGDRHYLAGWYTERELGFWLDEPSYNRLARLTGSRIPLVRADWWIAQTCRQLSLDNRQTGIGYYDWLGIGKRADVDRLVDLDRAASIRVGRELRALVVQGASGVAQQERFVARYQARTGAAWFTEDTDRSKDAPAQLDGTFRPKAEEAVIALPNGLWLYWLGDDNGAAQATAPDFIGGNRAPVQRGADTRIHVGLACVQCHVEAGLRPIDDWARRTLRSPQGLGVKSPAELVRLRRQYLSDLNGHLERDRAVYRDALARCCGLTPAELAQALSDTFYRYTLEGRDLARLALELGCSEADLAQALRAYLRRHGEWPQELAALATLTAREPGTLPVAYAERHYADLHRLLREYRR